LKAKKQSPTASQISNPADLNKIRLAIINKYAEVAVSAGGKFKYPTGRAGAEALGYDSRLVRDSQNELLGSFCGVGNPFAIAEIEPGDQVLDIGCGAGFDLLVASSLVGENGRVCGIDLTEDMVTRATRNMALASVTNVEIRHVAEEEIPYPDQNFDVVISNGVINLSPRKNALFSEIFRVLKPGGRLQFADIIRKKESAESLPPSPEAWAQ